MKTKPYESLAALSLALVGSVFVSCSFNFFRGGAAIVGFMGGAGLLAGAYGTYRKEQLTVDDFSAGLNTLAINANYIGTEVKPQIKRVIELPTCPPALKTAGALLLDSSSDEKWFSDLASGCFILAGKRGSGKSVCFRRLAAYFLEQNPKGTLRVFDDNYGKRESTDGDWFNLPRNWLGKPLTGLEMVFVDDPITPQGYIFDLIDEAHNVFLERKRAVQNGDRQTLHPHMLLITELDDHLSKWKKFDPEKHKIYSKKIIDLIFVAHGYKVFFGGETHSLAVGVIDFSEAQRSNLNLVLLGDFTTNRTEINRAIDDSSLTDGIIERVNTLVKAGAKRPAVIKIAGEQGAMVRSVPHIDLDAIEIRVPESAIPEEVRWCEELNWDIIAKSKGITLTKAWGQFGKGKMLGDNPYYSAFKYRFEQIKNQEFV